MVFNYLIDIELKAQHLAENEQLMNQLLIEIAETFEFQVLDVASHKFTPQGFTSMLLLAESHLTIHTWPELRFACIDLLTCKGQIDQQKLESIINESEIGMNCLKIQEIKREMASQPISIAEN